MEEEVKQIASGNFDKDSCLEKNLEWFEARYQELEATLSRSRVNDFGRTLSPTRDSLKHWRKLDAFETSTNTPVNGARGKTRSQ